MKKTVDLLHGRIVSALMRLALPIIGTSAIQMAYNMTDMLWIGMLGSDAVAAVGTAGLYTWLFSSVAALAKAGAQARVSQKLGAGEPEAALTYARAALRLVTALSILLGAAVLLFPEQLVAVFHLNGEAVIRQCIEYLLIAGALAAFNHINQVLGAIMTAAGDSLSPFWATVAGLALNVALDPLLILGIGGFPRLGVIGAAMATVFAQVVSMTALIVIARRDQLLRRLHPLRRCAGRIYADLVRIGLPVAIQTLLFSGISMVVARFTASWGDAAVAVQRVGNQAEQICWMMADGFSAAVNAFSGQNYGAGQNGRARKGYFTALRIAAVWGLICSAILMLGARPIFRAFLREPEIVEMGVSYLRIVGLSQIFICLESVTQGAFVGLGRPFPPSINSMVLTAARIPLLLALSATPLGLDGIWWALTISSILKGVVLVSWFIRDMDSLLPMKAAEG